MKKLIITLLCCLLCAGCEEKAKTTVFTWPAKAEPENNLASKSPIKAQNLDDYLFRKDAIYLDLRDAGQFYKEGHVGGFTNLPFYGYITDFKANKATLFSFVKKDKTSHFGDVGSYKANYPTAEKWIYDTLPRDKYILAISTSGVESAYFLNLLLQLGYDGTKLYNVGSFTTGMGDDAAYRFLKEARHLVAPLELYDSEIIYRFDLKKFKEP